MTVCKTGGLALLSLAALSACGGGGTPPSGSTSATPPPAIVRSYTFPSGDATASAGNTAWDITGVTTTLSGQFGDAGGNSYDTLRVDVTFAQNVANALPAPGQQLASGNQLGISVALDTDGNVATGEYSDCANQSGVTPFEYSTDAGVNPSRLADGNYSILQNGIPISGGGANAPAEAIVSISGNTMSETFFLTALGVNAGKTIPRIGIGVASFNSSLNATDCVPKPPTVEVFTI